MAETESLIERYLVAFNDRDHEAMLSCVGSDVVHDTRDGTREIGRDELRWRLSVDMRHFDESISDIAIMTGENGRRAAAEFTVRGTYVETAKGLPEADGQRYSVSAGMFFEVDGGKITRMTLYLERAPWLASMNAG